ncbi:MAG: dihydroorotate dehydrogenase electron transfer subunit [Gammaproteobacteria bacterium]|nr:dihydroorotate dehydrogenase electron transfer subunit [Gammaproteobacteria bacterium]
MTNKDIIFEEKAEIVDQVKFEADQFVTIVKAEKSSQTAKPGQFAFVECGGDTLLRRPLSYLRSSKEDGTVEFMYKTVGHGLESLSQLKKGDEIKIMGPIGNGFAIPSGKKSAILIGGGVGIPPVLFMGEEIKKINGGIDLVAFFGSEIPFPFETCDSDLVMPGLDFSVNKTIDDMEKLGIPCRLSSQAGYEGCHLGYVTELAKSFIETLSDGEKTETIIYACGPESMLKAVAKLAKDDQLDCVLSLEEYMACAIGGCAGCTVKVLEDGHERMKRVCVDGPVFDAEQLYF